MRDPRLFPGPRQVSLEAPRREDWSSRRDSEGDWFPLLCQATNLGTCAHIFRANDRDDFKKKWKETVRDKYLIEILAKQGPNVEVRVFVYEDAEGHLRTNDQYNTTLIEKALIKGGGLFDHVEDKFQEATRTQIKKYARRIFRVFGMKDYSRIDFFVENGTDKVLT